MNQNQSPANLQTKHIGKSKFTIGLLLGFVVGIFLGDYFKLGPWWLSGISAGLILALILFWREKSIRLAIIILIGFSLGYGYFSFWDNSHLKTNLTYGQNIKIEAPIISHPDFLANQANYLVRFENQKIQIITGRYPEYQYGDVLSIKGKLKQPSSYLLHQGISAQIQNPDQLEKVGQAGSPFLKGIYVIRDTFENSLNRIFPEPLASFAAGLILGSKRNIPDSLLTDFNRTGTTHIIAVSGYNVTIIIVYLGLILGLFSRRLKFWGSLVAIVLFVLMTGAPASVIRAGILAALVLFGRAQGRRVNMLILVLLVAALMLVFNPYALKYDLSFELSFLAFLGLVWLGPILGRLHPIKNLPKLLNSTLSETLGAQVLVLPILILAFGQLSFIAPIVNLLILWLVPTAMLLVFLAGLGGIIWYPIGLILFYPGYLVLDYIILVVQKLSALPFAAVTLKTNTWWWVPIYYLLIFLFIWWYSKKNTNS